MSTAYKRVVASGCSFTSNEYSNDPEPWAWPNHLAINHKLQVYNLAVAGAGNDHICRSLMVFLEKNNFDPKETLVAVMWSGVGRIDFLTSSGVPTSQRKYNYTDQTRLIFGGQWWNGNKSVTVEQLMMDYAKHQNNHSFALKSWLAMTSLESYLKSQGYPYFFTSFVNYKNNFIRGDAISVNYESLLADMNLSLDKSAWLPLADTDYLGDWCKKNNMLTVDNWHPGVDGPNYWTRDVLDPVLLQQGFFNGL